MFSPSTDDSTLPSSTCDTGSCSSQSFSSSNEYLDQSLDFLIHSSPLRHNYPANLDQLSRKANGYPSRDDLNTVSRYSSNASTPRMRPDASTPRTRLDQPASRGCSPDASALYNNTSKHYNPSVSGQHACQEMSDYRDWANSYLQYSPHSTSITDLPRDLADGRTLLYLVEVLLGVSLDPVHVKPALEVQKIENIQTCLDLLATHGIPVHDLSAEDIVEANPKVTLVLCKHLKQHFGSTSGSPQGSSELMTRRTPSPRTRHRSKSPTITHTLPATASTVIDIGDDALLDWVGQMTGQVVTDYNSFQDGHILCLLINKLTEGAVPDVVLEYGLPSEKVSLALMFAEEELGVSPDLCPDDVVNMKDAGKMSSFLTTLRRVFLQQVDDKEHEIQEMDKLTSREARETEANTRWVNEAELAPSLRNFSKRQTSQESRPRSDLSILHSGRRDCEEGSLVLHTDKMPPRFPSIPKVELEKHESLKESCPVEDGFSLYFQGSADQIPLENRLSNHDKDTRYFLEDLSNLHNSYRSSPSSTHHPFHLSDVSSKNSRNKSSSLRKLDAVSRYDEHLMHGLVHKERIFDQSENWEYLYTMPHAPLKSWQKERENAYFQLGDFRNELQRLKKEYFRLMNIKKLLTPDENNHTVTEIPFPPEAFVLGEDREFVSIDNMDCSSVDNEANKNTILAEKAVKKSGLISSCAMPYMNVRKGTLPPYRTWSKYENTEGDRYRYYESSIKTINREKSASQNESTATKIHSPEAAVRSRNGVESVKTFADCQGSQTDDVRQINLDCDNPLVSSPNKELDMQEFKSRDKDGGQRGVSGRHRYGMTALVRLCSKKANAVSDTDV